MKAAALIEPVSCVVRGFHRLQPQTGRDVPHLRRGTDGATQCAGRPLQRREPGRPDRHQSRADSSGRRTNSASSTSATNLEELRTIAPRGFDNVIEATGVTKVAESGDRRGQAARQTPPLRRLPAGRKGQLRRVQDLQRGDHDPRDDGRPQFLWSSDRLARRGSC